MEKYKLNKSLCKEIYGKELYVLAIEASFVSKFFVEKGDVTNKAPEVGS